MISANALVLSALIMFALTLPAFSVGVRSAQADPVKLPEPKYEGKVSVETALLERRSIRDYADEAVTLADVSQHRGYRYVHMEAGHAAQNVCLQAVSLDLGTVVIGAFDDDDIKKVMQLTATEEPLYIIPVGKRRR